MADLVHGASIRLLRFVRREDVSAGLSAPQLSVLSVLVFGGPQTMRALADLEQVRAPSMSRTVDQLVQLGLVQRVARAADRRVSEVHVTKKGTALLDEGRRKRLARLVGVLVQATPRELAALTTAAEVIVRVTDAPLTDGRKKAASRAP